MGDGSRGVYHAHRPRGGLLQKKPSFESFSRLQGAGSITSAITMTSQLPAKLFQAFTETHYIVHHEPPFTMNIGVFCPDLEKLMAERKTLCAAFITAWNPFAQQLSCTENEARQHTLKANLTERGLAFIDGIGQHPGNNWPGEPSVLILDMGREAAKALAGQYEQLAFVWADQTGVPSLMQPD